MRKALKIFLGIAIVLAVVYMLGPKSNIENLNGEYPAVPSRMAELEAFVKAKEDTVIGLKPGNHAEIVWADSINKSKTPYSIVYIHGFGASQMEGHPVHREIAAHFAANLYLVRLPEHGIDRKDAFRFLTAQRLVDEAKEAYMVGRSLGDSVIVIGTSMGGALSVVLASERADMKALVLYSPAIEAKSEVLNMFFTPWMGYIAEHFRYENGTLINNREGEKAKYWSKQYHMNAYRSLAVLIRSKMNASTFGEIGQPLFLGYYFKDEQNQDDVVSVPRMLEMFDQVSTPEALKVKTAFPEVGDHVIASQITSKDWVSVKKETIKFLETVAKIPLPLTDKDSVLMMVP